MTLTHMRWSSPSDRRILKPITTQKYFGQADRSITLDRNNTQAYVAKSLYLLVSSRPNDAFRAADAGLMVDPNSAPLHASRSIAETYLRQFEQAKSDVQQAMRLSPRDPALSQWHNFTADAEIGLGNFDTAIDECNKAIDGVYSVPVCPEHRNRRCPRSAVLQLRSHAASSDEIVTTKSAAGAARHPSPRSGSAQHGASGLPFQQSMALATAAASPELNSQENISLSHAAELTIEPYLPPSTT